MTASAPTPKKKRGPPPRIADPKARAQHKRQVSNRNARNTYDRHKHEYNDHRREKRFRFRARRAGDPPIAGHAIVAGRLLNRPDLLYLDRHGVLHAEKELSAEQLIARWNKSQQKKGVPPQGGRSAKKPT